MKKLFVRVAVLSLGFFIFSNFCHANMTWDMPTPYPDKTFHTVNIRMFAEDVNEATNGKLTIQVHSANSLFKHAEIKNAIRSGQVQIGEVLLSMFSNEDKIYGIDTMPFLVDSYEKTELLWKAQKKAMTKIFDKQNMICLYRTPWPPQCLYSKKEINDVKDLQGLKFRAYSPVQQQFAAKLGLLPVQVDAPDIPQAFATGMVEAMLTSPTTGVSSNAWDFLNYYYEVKAWLPSNVVLVNKRVWRKLDEQTRQAVLKAAEKAEKRGIEMSRKEAIENTKELQANGIKVYSHSEIQPLINELKKAGDELMQEWMNQGDPEYREVIEEYKALLK